MKIEGSPVPTESLPNKIDSQILHWYLFSDDYPNRVSSDDIAPRLDLTAWKPWVEELVESVDFVEISKDKQHPLVPGDSLAGLCEDIKNTTGYSMETPREVARIIYWREGEVPGGVIEASPIIKGKHNRVAVNYLDFLLNRQKPLLSIHNHPSGSFFSLNDVESLVTGFEIGGQVLRHLNGIMVVAEDIQLLGLATNKTPLMTQMQWSQQREKESKRIYRSGMIEDMRQVLDEDTLQAMLKSYYLLKLFPKEENDEKISPVTGELFKLLDRKIAQENQRMTMDAMVYCRDNLGIKLYSATDMERFVEFSA